MTQSAVDARIDALRRQGFSGRRIAETLRREGHAMSASTVDRRLRELRGRVRVSSSRKARRPPVADRRAELEAQEHAAHVAGDHVTLGDVCRALASFDDDETRSALANGASYVDAVIHSTRYGTAVAGLTRAADFAELARCAVEAGFGWTRADGEDEAARQRAVALLEAAAEIIQSQKTDN